MVKYFKPYSAYQGPIPEAQPLEFAEALRKIRETYGCVSWPDFCYRLKSEKDFEICSGTLQHYSPCYRRTGAPTADFLFNLESLNCLVFPNLQRVTAVALIEIFYGKRDSDGNLVKTQGGF